MGNYIFDSRLCKMPVVNMLSGRVVSSSLVPMYRKNDLQLECFELQNENEKLYLPMDGLRFINDICIMVMLPKEPYLPDTGKLCQLVGMPLSATVGSFPLFSFGKIVSTENAENGRTISLKLDDGHVIPLDNNSEAVPADAFKETFEMNAAENLAPQNRGSFYQQNTDQSDKQSRSDFFSFKEEAPAEKAAPVEKAAPAETPAKEKPAAKAPVKKEVRRKAANGKNAKVAKAAAEKKSQDDKSPAKNAKNMAQVARFIIHRYFPPIISLLLYFVFYVFLYSFLGSIT